MVQVAVTTVTVIITAMATARTVGAVAIQVAGVDTLGTAATGATLMPLRWRQLPRRFRLRPQPNKRWSLT